MEKERGNLDDVLPRESFGTRFAHYTFLELGFWAVVALLWLTLEGGVVGLIITVIVALIVGFAWRDIARRSKNPIQASDPPNEH